MPIKLIVDRANSIDCTYIDLLYSRICITDVAEEHGYCWKTAKRGIMGAYERQKAYEDKIIQHYLHYDILRRIKRGEHGCDTGIE